MRKSLYWLLLGIVLTASGVYLMTLAHRENNKGKVINSRKRSALWSFVEFIVDLTLGVFTGGPVFGLGALAVFLFIIGFLMALINFTRLIHP